MGRWQVYIGVAVGVVSALLGPAGPAWGLVLHPGSETPPSVRPDDAAIGRWSTNASCAAVGPNYIVTTCHQGGGVGTRVYFPDSADADALPDEYEVAEIFQHNKADLRVVRLTPVGGTPDLSYYIQPYTGTNEIFHEAVVGGYGVGRGSTLVNGADIAYGYAWAGSDNLTLRWGQNRIDGTGQGNGSYVSAIMTAHFDGTATGLSAEAAIADFDSGGGWFIDVDSGPDVAWRLAGLSRAAEHAHDAESLFRNPATGAPDPDYLDAVRIGSYADWILGILEPHRWTGGPAGAWSASANWSGGVPNAAERWAVFTDDAPGRTVTLDAPATVGVLRFDAATDYTLTGVSTLTLRSDDNVAGIEINRTSTTVWYGAHRIETPVYLASPLVVTQRSAGAFTMAGAISGPGGIRKTGWGVMVLESPNTFLGDVFLDAGTLQAAHPNALGAGDIFLDGGRLTLAWDADTLYPNDLTVMDSAEVCVQPLAAGTDRTLSLASLTTDGFPTLTVTGSDDYTLAVQGQTCITPTPSPVTLATKSADVVFAGGIQMVTGALTKTGPGTLNIAGLQAYGTDTQMNVDGGTLCLASDAGPVTAVLALHVRDASATARFASVQHLAELHLAAGRAECAPGGASTIVTAALGIDADAGGTPNAVLDLADNNLVVDYEPGASPYAAIEAWIASGLAGPLARTWDGPGITSSAADATLYALGVLDNADPPTFIEAFNDTDHLFDGEAVDATSVLVKYTYYGDTNLDGAVTPVDVQRLILSWNGQTEGDPRWAVGDFNYDGAITPTDVQLLIQGWNQQGAPLSAAAPAPADAVLAGTTGAVLNASASPDAGVVPEPASLLLVALGATGAWASRRFGRRSACG